MINSRPLRVSTAVLAAAFACMLSLLAAAPAWADSYTAALQTESNTTTLAVGDEFTVGEVLTDNDASAFTMYALSSQVTFDTAKLQLVSVAAGQYGVATIQSNTVVYNALSGPFAGTIIDSPFLMCTATFKVIAEGDPNIKFKRISVSTYSGMHSFPVSTTGLTVVDKLITPSASEQTEPGTATEAEANESSVDQFKKNVTSLSDITEDGMLNKDALDNAYRGGLTDDDLKSLGLTQEEINKAAAGEEFVPSAASEEDKALAAAANGNTSNANANASSSSQSSNSSNSSNSASQSNGVPIVPIVVIIVIVVAAAIVGGVAYSKSKKKASDEGLTDPSDGKDAADPSDGEGATEPSDGEGATKE